MDTVIKLERPQVGDGGEAHLGAHFILTFAKTRGEVPKPPELDVKLMTGEHGHCTWAYTPLTIPTTVPPPIFCKLCTAL